MNLSGGTRWSESEGKPVILDLLLVLILRIHAVHNLVFIFS
jgi:hypothetical protein